MGLEKYLNHIENKKKRMGTDETCTVPVIGWVTKFVVRAWMLLLDP